MGTLSTSSLRARRGLSGVVLACTLACPLAATAGEQKQPRAVPSGDFVLAKGDNRNITFSFQIQSDPGEGAYVFWAQQFYLEDGDGGYLGFQRNGPQKLIIFSLWNTLESVALLPGAVAEPFGGEGEGQHVIGPFDWQLGHTYRFRLFAVPGTQPTWWQVSIQDATTGQSWDLGAIRALEGWNNLSDYVTTFTETYVNGSRCETIPYARAVLDAPVADDGQVRTVRTKPRTYGRFEDGCDLMQNPGAQPGVNVGSRSDRVGKGLMLQIGLNNGPQRWGDFDRQGVVGQFFRHGDPQAGATSYFKLKALDADGRYGAFPSGGQTANRHWTLLGSTEPYFNGPLSRVDGEVAGQCAVGRRYFTVAAPGLNRYYEVKRAVPRQWCMPLPAGEHGNAFWTYLGANIGPDA